MFMNRTGVALLSLISTLAIVGCASAQPAPPMINPVGSTVDDTLDALQARGQNLKEFTADITLTTTDQDMQTATVQSGKATYQAKSDGDARLHVLLDKLTATGTPKNEKIEYLLDGGWLTDRDYRRKLENRRQVVKPGEKLNLFQLGKGPFPLPIGQDKAEVHKLFDVEKIAPAKDDPAGSVHLKLKPKEKTDLARKFKVIDVWVDPKTNMPVRVTTLDKNETTERRTDFGNLQINPQPGVREEDFKLPAIDDTGWNKHEESYGD